MDRSKIINKQKKESKIHIQLSLFCKKVIFLKRKAPFLEGFACIWYR